jgi:hypothetical protein
MAYVAVSRGAQDAQIFTSDREKLPHVLGRDVSHQSAYVPKIAKGSGQMVEPKQTVSANRNEEAQAAHDRHWKPLREALTPQQAGQFAWIRETDSIQSYRHLETGRCIHIDGQDGSFYDRHREPITTKEALNFAMPPGQNHSHSAAKQEKDIEHGYGLGM